MNKIINPPEYVTLNGDHSITITLSRDYDFSGEKRNTITLREPTAGDVIGYPIDRNASSTELGKAEVNIMASLANGVTPKEILGLAVKDYARLNNAYNYFLD